MQFNFKKELTIGPLKIRISSNGSLLLQVASRPILSLPDTSVLEKWKFTLKVGGFQ